MNLSKEFPIYTVKSQSETYPYRLKQIYNAPQTLYVRGTLPHKDISTLCIIGSREPTEYGVTILKYLMSEICELPICIISGLARGIDALSHEYALQYSISCIAVPGSGIDEKSLYPRKNIDLARNILISGGSLVSELPPTTKTARWHFPARNRIMSGLADAVLIIEAREKSGTLITAYHALNANREVLAVPGSITSPASSGTHELIRNGAQLIRNGRDIADALKLEITTRRNVSHLGFIHASQNQKQQVTDLTQDEKNIYDALESPQTHDFLCLKLSLPPSKLLVYISSLEMKGLILISQGIIRKKAIL
jgi:DNA processing protein